MYIEDRLFSEISGEVTYSVTMTEEEYDLFSEFSLSLEQREFNSKVAKALKEKWLKKAAGDLNTPVYESKGFRTVEIDPKTWKKDIRGKLKHEYTTGFNNKTRKYESLELTGKHPITDRDAFNRSISRKSPCGSASEYLPRYSKPKKSYKKDRYLERYDHGTRDYKSSASARRYLVEDAKAERLKTKIK